MLKGFQALVNRGMHEGESHSPSSPGTDYLVCFNHKSAQRSFAGYVYCLAEPSSTSFEGPWRSSYSEGHTMRSRLTLALIHCLLFRFWSTHHFIGKVMFLRCLPGWLWRVTEINSCENDIVPGAQSVAGGRSDNRWKSAPVTGAPCHFLLVFWTFCHHIPGLPHPSRAFGLSENLLSCKKDWAKPIM